MKRSTLAVAVVAVLVATASGAAATGGTAAQRLTAAAATSTVPTRTVTAFHLPALTTAPHLTTRPAAVRHHRHYAHGPCPGTTASPHFATAEAAMSYLARAWNHDDLDALCHVTDPQGRRWLLRMHHEAVHLRLARCHPIDVGWVGCTFRHDYPRRMHKSRVGHAFFEAKAALTPGWYMTGVVACG